MTGAGALAAMAGHGPYVLGAYAVVLAVLAMEAALLALRLRSIETHLGRRRVDGAPAEGMATSNGRDVASGREVTHGARNSAGEPA